MAKLLCFLRQYNLLFLPAGPCLAGEAWSLEKGETSRGCEKVEVLKSLLTKTCYTFQSSQAFYRPFTPLNYWPFLEPS